MTSFAFMAKFLVVRFSSLGDIILTSPVLRCLKKQVVDAEVHFITKSNFSFLLNDNPYVDKIYTINSNLQEVMSELRTEKYDYIIDLHHNLRSLRLKKGLSAKSYSFNKLNLEKWMLVQLGINNMPNQHIVDRYMQTVESFGVKNDREGLDYYIPNKDEVDVLEFPITDSDYIAMVIGGTYQGKKMPVEKICSIVDKINANIVLVGGPEDAEVGRIVSEVNPKRIFNACGKFNFNQSASIVKQSKVVISHDTGLMHVAAAFKKKIISVWGCTSPLLGMPPYMADKQSVIVEPLHLKKRPCSKLGNRCKYPNWKCVHDIPEDKIIESVEELNKEVTKN